MAAESRAQVGDQTPEAPATPEAIEETLRFAWYRFNSYDSQASALKRRYQQIRQVIIGVSWATTVFAVLSVLVDPLQILQMVLFGILLVIVAFTILSAPFNDEDQVQDQKPVEGLGSFIRAAARNARKRWWLTVVAVGVALLLIFLGLLPFVNPASLDILKDNLAVVQTVFQIILVALPLLSAGLLTFASRFESGASWVGFRIAAEMIKRGIYGLRVQRALREPGEKDLVAVTRAIKEAGLRLDTMGVTTPSSALRLMPVEGRVTPGYVDDKKDDGYAPMTIQDYIGLRLIHQANWYRQRAGEDYTRTRIFRMVILVVGALGTFFAAFGRGDLVAFNVTAVTALTAWLALMQHEQKYSLYSSTAKKIEDELADFRIRQKDAKTIEAFVLGVEGIFAQERDVWRMSVLQGQEATEETLAQMVSTHSTQIADFEAWAGIPREEEGEEEESG